MKLLWIFLLTFSAFASSLERDVRRFLPTEIQGVTLGKSGLKEVEAAIGLHSLREGSRYYWIYKKSKYALELTIEKDVVTVLHFNFVSSPMLQAVAPNLKESSFTHLRGSPKNWLTYREKNLELTLDRLTKGIVSVRLK